MRGLRDFLFAWIRSKLGISLRDLRGTDRHAEVVEARALFVWAALTLDGGRSLRLIARWLSAEGTRRDHSSVRHWQEKGMWMAENDADFAQLTEDLARDWRIFKGLG